MRKWVERALLIHQLIIKESGGNDFYVDEKRLESAIFSVFATFEDKDLYPTKEEKAARLCFNIITDHTFTEGNKRIGLHMMLLFLKSEGINVVYDENELVELGFGVASNRISYRDIVDWINVHKI